MKWMKRAIKRVAIYLLLGFVMSWLVAWGLGLIPRLSWPWKTMRQDTIIDSRKDPTGRTSAYYLNKYRWFGVWEDQYATHMRFNNKIKMSQINMWWAWDPTATPPVAERIQTLIADFPEASFPKQDTVYSDLKYGWPAMSTRCTGAANDQVRMPDGSLTRSMRRAFSTPLRTNSAYMSGFGLMPLARSAIFPYDPIWAGLAVNTVFYATIIFVFTSIRRAFRHARRLRKGRCPICSYDLQFDNTLGCTECGWRKGSEARA